MRLLHVLEAGLLTNGGADSCKCVCKHKVHLWGLPAGSQPPKISPQKSCLNHIQCCSLLQCRSQARPFKAPTSTPHRLECRLQHAQPLASKLTAKAACVSLENCWAYWFILSTASYTFLAKKSWASLKNCKRRQACRQAGQNAR